MLRICVCMCARVDLTAFLSKENVSKFSFRQQLMVHLNMQSQDDLKYKQFNYFNVLQDPAD